MGHRFHKHKLLLDENFSPRTRFPILNANFDLKHIRDDFKKDSISDNQVYSFAAKQKRIVITYNIKDFKPLANKSTNTGIIGVTSNLPLRQIDRKLTALLMKSSSNALFGKFTMITGES